MSFSPPIEVAQIRSNRICIYNEYEHSITGRKTNANSLKNLQTDKYKGEMTATARKNLDKVLINWSDSVNNLSSAKLGYGASKSVKMVMLTLTLPATQLHSDKFIKRSLLSRYLIVLKRKYCVDNYVWKAEFQENDNIHFHIVIDKFVPHAEARSEWNRILADYGYIDRFEAKNGHRNPNTTDIHVVKSKEKGFGYLQKYMSKSQVCRLEGGKCWGCSESLEALKSVVLMIDNSVNNMINEIVEVKGTKTVKLDNATIIYADIVKFMKSNHKEVYKEYKHFLECVWEIAVISRNKTKPIEIVADTPF